MDISGKSTVHNGDKSMKGLSETNEKSNENGDFFQC